VAIAPTRSGLARLLAAVRPDELERFCSETLGPLAAHDLRTGDDLLRTLEVFATCGGVSETARQLSAHRNTVRHRIARAEALLTADLNDPEQRLRLSVALRCQRLLSLRRAAGFVQSAQAQPT